MRGFDVLRHARRPALLALLLALAVAGCGGGGSGGGSSDPGAALPPLGAGESAYDDAAAYSTQAAAALQGAVEGAAVTKHTLALAGASIAYSARAGHLIARDPASGAAEASMFYVAYTADGASPATRPVTFVYNGGPGSASVWLHLGSFGPKRLATGLPATSATTPFAFVDNAESLLDTTDLVFVDAVGCGLSEAIAPYANRSFWSVDADAAVFRDFIVRWLAANGRAASPRVLYGESYGGPRTAVLARRLLEAGVGVDAVVLQSPVLDYNSNCDVQGAGSCGSYLPSYGALGAWYRLTTPVPADIDAWMATLRDVTATRYEPALTAFFGGTPPPADLPPLLAADTGLPVAYWQAQFNLPPLTFRTSLVPGSLIGRYDGRVVAANGSPLTREGDPSSTFITASFASTIATYLRDSLRYANPSTYVLLSNAIADWDFSHAGRALPDTVPDLAAALTLNPALRVLAISGYHDLATPFRTTELDLARLGADPRVQVRNYPGGHMSYLDDATRVRQKADLAAFYRGTLAALALRPARALPLAARALPAVDRSGAVPTLPQAVVAEPAIQTPLRDPWVPPRR